MKILINSLNFSPEITGIGKYSGEMAEWLAKKGHEVKVVTASPYYPDWKVADGYYSGSYYRDDAFGFKVIRCPLWVPSKPSGIKRIIHLISFAVSSFPIMLSHIFWRPDVVWVVVPSMFSTPSVLLVSKLCGARTWLHIQDFEIDAAFDLGLLKGRLLKNLILAFEKIVLDRFDMVSTISSKMMQKLRSKRCRENTLFPNWVDISKIHPLANSDKYRAEFGIPKDACVVLYSGNMGNKQGLEILSDTARLLCDSNGIYFIFCGNGSGRDDLVLGCENLRNVIFLDLQPYERLGELLATANIHLLPQRSDAADLVMPSKLTGMLASGRPIIATAHPGTEVALVVEGRGIVVPPEDPKALASAIAYLAANPDLCSDFGRSARKYAEEYLDVDSVLNRFQDDLSQLISRK